MQSDDKARAKKNEYAATWYAKNKERVSEKNRNRYHDDPEYHQRKLETNRRWLDRHRDEKNAREREHRRLRDSDPDKRSAYLTKRKMEYERRKDVINQRRRERYNEDPEKGRKQSRMQYQKNRKKILEKDKKRRDMDPTYREKVRIKNKKSGKKRRDTTRQRIFEILGRSCVVCGYSDMNSCDVDHIHNDGAADRKRLGGHVWDYYVNHPDEARRKVQILCSNCNAKKEMVLRRLPDAIYKWFACPTNGAGNVPYVVYARMHANNLKTMSVAESTKVVDILKYTLDLS